MKPRYKPGDYCVHKDGRVWQVLTLHDGNYQYVIKQVVYKANADIYLPGGYHCPYYWLHENTTLAEDYIIDKVLTKYQYEVD